MKQITATAPHPQSLRSYEAFLLASEREFKRDSCSMNWVELSGFRHFHSAHMMLKWPIVCKTPGL